MKKFFVTMIALVATLGISAQNEFSFKTNNGDKLAIGSDMTVHVYFDNVGAEVNGFQINFDFPEGIGLKENSVIFQEDRYNGDDLATAFTFQYKKKTKDYRAIFAGATGKRIVGEGELFCFDLEVTDPSIATEKKTLKIKNFFVLDEKGTELDATCTDWEFEVVGSDTGIESVSVENNAPVYNLAGMLMNGNLQKGIYVQNGKKYIVK
jgi:hypothetical protein